MKQNVSPLRESQYASPEQNSEAAEIVLMNNSSTHSKESSKERLNERKRRDVILQTTFNNSNY